MENKEQDRALQTPAEANRDKHMNYLAAEEKDTNNDVRDEENDKDIDQPSGQGNKHDADRGNDSINEMLQEENLIDPGNEHNHLQDPKNRTDNYHSQKFDGDDGGNATESTGTKPG